MNARRTARGRDAENPAGAKPLIVAAKIESGPTRGNPRSNLRSRFAREDPGDRIRSSDCLTAPRRAGHRSPWFEPHAGAVKVIETARRAMQSGKRAERAGGKDAIELGFVIAGNAIE